MAGSKGSKYYDVFLKYQICLSKNNTNIIDEQLFSLLKGIDKNGSLSSSAKELGISYRKAWGDIRRAEEVFGFSFVEKQRGGSAGGASILTKDGKNILNAYNELILEFDNTISSITKKFFRKIND